MATPRPWTVLPHRAIEKHEDNLWSVEGPVPGMALKRRMVLAKLASGRVVIHGAMPLEATAMRAIEAWGEPAVLIVPNGYHRSDAHAFKQRYPGLRVICPAGADARVRQAVALDGHFDSFPADAGVRVETLDGVKAREGVLSVQSPRGRTTLVFNDVLFNLPHQPGFQGFMLRTIGSSGGPRVTLIARAAIVAEKRALAEHYRRLADTPGLARVIPGHGDVIESDAPGVLRAVAARL